MYFMLSFLQFHKEEMILMKALDRRPVHLEKAKPEGTRVT